MTEEKLTRALTDGGCTPEEISCFLEKWQSGEEGEALQMLERRRKLLLEEFNRSKACMDTLDYLVFQIEKNRKAAGL